MHCFDIIIYARLTKKIYSCACQDLRILEICARSAVAATFILEEVMLKKIKGDKDVFAIEYGFCDDSHDTEIAMYVDGINILEYERNSELFTTRWNIDKLALWLRKFIDEMAEDPYPVDCGGTFAAQKDDAAREFDSADDEVFETYYQRLYEWDLRHRWHVASSGAILADVYFQMVGDNVEVSWDNRNVEDGVTFKSLTGGAKISKEYFISTVDSFLKDYALHWF